MATIKLTGSVGIDGDNKYDDIMTIQKALNARIHLISPTKKLKEDGSVGKTEKVIKDSKTVAAIMAFQKKVCKFKPDGLIDVGKGTHRKLNETGAKKLTELLTFPGTKFQHRRCEMTLEQCLAGLRTQRHLRPKVKAKVKHVITEMHKLGFAFGLYHGTAGYRTWDDQRNIKLRAKKEGRNPLIARPGESFHHYGFAVDLGCLEWIDKTGRKYKRDVWLGGLEKHANTRISGKIWKKRDSFCSASLYPLKGEMIHLQSYPAKKSAADIYVRILNKAAKNKKSEYKYKRSGPKSRYYQVKTSKKGKWVTIGTALSIYRKKMWNIKAAEQNIVHAHMKEAETIAKTFTI